MTLRGIQTVIASAASWLLLLGMSSDNVSAFVPSKTMSTVSTIHEKTGIHPRPPTVSLNAIVPTTVEAIQEMTNSRFAFWMCFAGATGVGSIGRELIPIVFGRYQSTSSLESERTTANQNRAAAKDGDEDLGIWGYPEKIYRRDVEMILNNKLTPLAIAKKYPIAQDKNSEERFEYTYLKDPVPFLGYDGFVKANPKANPVALRAVFDSFSNSIGGSNAVSPIVAERNIETYLSGTRGKATVTGAMAKKLNGGKALGIAAFFFLLVLLGVADALAIFHVWKGWFPEWQGFSNIPASLFDKDTGISTLPNFFVLDVPES